MEGDSGGETGGGDGGNGPTKRPMLQDGEIFARPPDLRQKPGMEF